MDRLLATDDLLIIVRVFYQIYFDRLPFSDESVSFTDELIRIYLDSCGFLDGTSYFAVENNTFNERLVQSKCKPDRISDVFLLINEK